jgi:hypothetical protein
MNTFFFVVWFLGTVACFLMGIALLYDSKNDREKVLSARVIVMSPIWPLIAIPWVIWIALGMPWKHRIQKGKVNVIRRP